MIVVGTMQYTRTEYELDGTRITIDRDVRATDSTPALEFLLIEVKGAMIDELKIIKPFESDKFGKWKWITGKWKYE